MKWHSFLDYFVPQGYRIDEWNYRRHRAFAGVCFVSALYGLLYIPQVIIEEYYGALAVILIFAPVCIALPFLLKANVPLRLLTNLYLANMLFSAARIMYISGGVLDTATDPQILVVLPMIALFFLNLRASIAWFIIGAGTIILFGVLETQGVDFKTELNPRYINYQAIAAVAGHLLIVMMVVNMFETQKNIALKALEEKNAIIEQEKKRSDNLLLNILPQEVMEELKETGRTTARSYDLVTVMFADFKDFTLIAEKLPPEELVTAIDEYFTEFDKIIDRYGIEKIKTVGDAYLCAGGLPIPNTKNPVQVVETAFAFLNAVDELSEKRKAEGKFYFNLRIGIHSGPLVAGVVGSKKFEYDIWGDAVNTAARMQQTSVEHKINISGTTYELIKHRYDCTHRGMIETKNKGLVDMYFVDHKK